MGFPEALDIQRGEEKIKKLCVGRRLRNSVEPGGFLAVARWLDHI